MNRDQVIQEENKSDKNDESRKLESKFRTIRSTAASIHQKLSSLSINQPSEWPNILAEFNVLSKQFETLNNEFFKTLYGEHEELLIIPDTIEELENTMNISEFLRTKLSPEIEQENKSLVELWEEENNCKIEECNISEIEDNIQRFSEMIERILNPSEPLFIFEKMSPKPVQVDDTQSILERFRNSINAGENLIRQM